MSLLSLFGKYIWNILVAIDRLVNAILGGSPEMTISGRVGTWYENTLLRKVIDYLFGNEHCENESIIEKNDESDRIIN